MVDELGFSGKEWEGDWIGGEYPTIAEVQKCSARFAVSVALPDATLRTKKTSVVRDVVS